MFKASLSRYQELARAPGGRLWTVRRFLFAPADKSSAAGMMQREGLISLNANGARRA
jgi:hypothetical protein